MLCEPAEWKRRVCLRGCQVCPGLRAECEGPLQAHHVVTQQALRKRGLEFLLWDTRNGLAVCARAHRRHTNATERIPYRLLSADSIEFATEAGLDWQLERYYPKTPQTGEAPNPGSSHTVSAKR